MDGLDRMLRDFRRSYREVGAEHSFDIWKAGAERRTHEGVHAALEDISVKQAAHHMGVEELIAYLATGLAYRIFPHERLKRDPRFGKKAEQVVQALIRTHHRNTIRAWHERELATAQLTPDAMPPGPLAQGFPGADGISAGTAPGSGTLPGQSPSTPAIRSGSAKLSGAPRRLWSKALIITVPLGVLLLFWPPNGKSVQIPGVIHFLAGIVVASLGSPRLRRIATGLVIIVVIFAVIVTIWSNHVIAHH